MAQDPKDNVYFGDDGSVEIPAGKIEYPGGTAVIATGSEINSVCDASTRLVNVTGATVTLSAATHGNKVVTLNRAGGVAVTLPAASGTGVKYTLYVGTTFTSDGTVKVANASDTMVGGVGIATDIAGVTVQAGGTDDTITLNGGTTGGVVGSVVHLIDIATNLWLVEGQLVSTGTEADPFSATVS